MEQHVTISGMNCEACVKLVTKKLTKVENVEAVTVSLNTESAVISSSNSVSVPALRQALAGTHYDLQAKAIS